MIRTEFQPPFGEMIENIKIEEMKKFIINDFETFWQKGCGDGSIDFYVDGKKQSTLMIEPNVKYGIYLNYTDHRNQEEWLSLSDMNNLDQVAETANEIYASIGLFLAKEIAWKGIKEFLQTGERSQDIEWVKPNIIPEDGNY
ncbi:hypothetical protein [Clostridium felsineum]|uniref:Uncharacterized protein n=1 Tax=Clostridium felsineum TaxID=36839 RepID=A0A1S8L8A8_9CLOT|nr:hypothetical protein [Clostridium felsineum]URZ08856.1 hypothetical protein CLROS_042500 [Clostridium felsineum]URZ09484.1 hypothetical protein CROST_001550 [Clostridium felsineum]